jgi:TetR/AcrR family transcriptional regulator
VNEAILFRHYPSKEELYWAVIDELSTRSRRRETLQASVDLQASDHEIFRVIAEDMLRRSKQDKNRTRLLLFSGLENHRLANRFYKTYVTSYYSILAGHIEKRIAQGAFRRIDPLLAARGFIGMLFYHNLVQEIFGGGVYQNFDPATVSAELTDIWLRGVLAPAKTNGNGHSSKNGNGHKNGRKK